MAKIDFFKDEEEINAALFGICDDEDEAEKTPAYASTEPAQREQWIAIVENRTKEPVYFIAVDNKIEIKRENGEMENRCDALLRHAKYIIFVELKDQRKDWITHAVEEQLLTTIRIFKNCHDINAFRHRMAYACNKKHPTFAVSHKEYMQRFKNEYGVRLIIGCDIVIK